MNNETSNRNRAHAAYRDVVSQVNIVTDPDEILPYMTPCRQMLVFKKKKKTQKILQQASNFSIIDFVTYKNQTIDVYTGHQND